jgi:hypothetical protein
MEGASDAGFAVVLIATSMVGSVLGKKNSGMGLVSSP